MQCLFIGMKQCTYNLARTSYDTLCQLDLEACLQLMVDQCGQMLASSSREDVEETVEDAGRHQVKLLVTRYLDAFVLNDEFEQFWSSALELHVGKAR